MISTEPMISTRGAWSQEFGNILFGGKLHGGKIPDDNAVLQTTKVHTLSPEQVEIFKNQGLGQVYFRECDLSKSGKPQYIKRDFTWNNEKKMTPYRQSIDGNALDAHGFPSECGTALGDHTYNGDRLDKATNFIAEIFATTRLPGDAGQGGDALWYRVGILHLSRHGTIAELQVICLNAGMRIKTTHQSLFHMVMNFAFHFVRGAALDQSTSSRTNILVKYANPKKAYGNANEKARAQWAMIGKRIYLDATSLKSMTRYMHEGFYYAPLTQVTLFNGQNVGMNVVAAPLKEHDAVVDYLNLCAATELENPNAEFFSDALWTGMQTLAKFKDHRAVKRVQDAINAGEDEADPANVRGTTTDRFAYASFALAVALTMFYADPIDMSKGTNINENMSPEQVEAAHRENEEKATLAATEIEKVLQRVRKIKDEDIKREESSNHLVTMMLKLVQRLKPPHAAIQMVRDNTFD